MVMLYNGQTISECALQRTVHSDFCKPHVGSSTPMESDPMQCKGMTQGKITVFLFTGPLILCITVSQSLFSCQRKCQRGCLLLRPVFVPYSMLFIKEAETLREQNTQQRDFYINLLIKHISFLKMLITKYLNTGI